MTGVADGASPPGPLRDQAVVPAPIGRRAAARLIDFALGVAIFMTFVWVISAAARPSPDGTGPMLVSIVLAFLGYLLYEVVLVGAKGRTLGKQVMGLKVVRIDTGDNPGLWRSFLRNLVPTTLLLAFFPLYPMPYIAAAIAKDHRWPHDRLAGTRVVVRGS